MKKGDTLFLDNLSAHKISGALDSLYKKGINIMFLPRYSPDFNPIELAWSKIKSTLRKLKARTTDALNAALKIALDSLSESDCLNWFMHAGYSTTKC
jgi:transposase